MQPILMPDGKVGLTPGGLVATTCNALPGCIALGDPALSRVTVSFSGIEPCSDPTPCASGGSQCGSVSVPREAWILFFTGTLDIGGVHFCQYALHWVGTGICDPTHGGCLPDCTICFDPILIVWIGFDSANNRWQVHVSATGPYVWSGPVGFPTGGVTCSCTSVHAASVFSAVAYLPGPSGLDAWLAGSPIVMANGLTTCVPCHAPGFPRVCVPDSTPVGKNGSVSLVAGP